MCGHSCHTTPPTTGAPGWPKASGPPVQRLNHYHHQEETHTTHRLGPSQPKSTPLSLQASNHLPRRSVHAPRRRPARPRRYPHHVPPRLFRHDLRIQINKTVHLTTMPSTKYPVTRRSGANQTRPFHATSPPSINNTHSNNQGKPQFLSCLRTRRRKKRKRWRCCLYPPHHKLPSRRTREEGGISSTRHGLVDRNDRGVGIWTDERPPFL